MAVSGCIRRVGTQISSHDPLCRCQPCSVGASPRREAIAAALRNLIENAARVTPAGGTIQVFAGPHALLGVRDEGPGLALERLRDLVQRHRRADRASKGDAGLGLASVDRIMAAHGGTLETDPADRELVLRFPAT